MRNLPEVTPLSKAIRIRRHPPTHTHTQSWCDGLCGIFQQNRLKWGWGGLKLINVNKIMLPHGICEARFKAKVGFD